jgi:hypothetical protein
MRLTLLFIAVTAACSSGVSSPSDTGDNAGADSDVAGGDTCAGPTCTAAADPGPTVDTCPAATPIGTPPECFPEPAATADNGKSWGIIYTEEFDEAQLDTTKLTPCFDWNTGDCTSSFNNGKEHYQASQVQLSGGTAKLVAEPLQPALDESGCFNASCTYKAGLISTARPLASDTSYLFPFTYGYVESRMKFPGTPGFFTAFWMLPTDTSYDYNTEIDIVEILGGYSDSIFMTYHYDGRNTSYTPNDGAHNNGACAVKDYSQGWVTFAIDWAPTHVAWYIDGVKCGQFDGDETTIENGPMQIILHMMVDNNWERDWDSTLSSQTLKAQLEVDYLRIYQQH